MDTVIRPAKPDEPAIVERKTVALAPFNPTCDQAIQQAIRMLNLKPGNVLFDIGCGDARLLIEAATQHDEIHCVGFEIDAKYVGRAGEAIRQLPAKIRQRVQVHQADAMAEGRITRDQSFSAFTLTLMDDADAVYLFLLPHGLQEIKPLLDAVVERRISEDRELVIVTYMFQMSQWPMTAMTHTKGNAPMYLYHFKARLSCAEIEADQRLAARSALSKTANKRQSLRLLGSSPKSQLSDTSK